MSNQIDTSTCKNNKLINIISNKEMIMFENSNDKNSENNSDNSNDNNSESLSITNSSLGTAENTVDIAEEIPNINDIDLSKKETFYYKIIDRYYRTLENDKIDLMINIVDGKSKISLRLLDWFVTRYANKYKVRFDKIKDKLDTDIDKCFNVHISYKAQLKSYKKRYFDPFRRRKKFMYYFNAKNIQKEDENNIKIEERKLCTTIGQLNFFKWAFSNDIIRYVSENYNAISKSMISTNKLDKSRKLKEKKNKDKIEKQELTDKNKLIEIIPKKIGISNKNQNSKISLKSNDSNIIKNINPEIYNNKILKNNEITIVKNGINISAKKKIQKNEVKIVLSFD